MKCRSLILVSLLILGVCVASAGATGFSSALMVKGTADPTQKRVVVYDPDGIRKLLILGDNVAPVEIVNNDPAPSRVDVMVQGLDSSLAMMPLEILVEDTEGSITKHVFDGEGVFAIGELKSSPDGTFRLQQRLTRLKSTSEVFVKTLTNVRTVDARIQIGNPDDPAPSLAGFLVVTGRLDRPDFGGEIAVELGKPGDPWQVVIVVGSAP